MSGDSREPRVAAILLAAGRSSRMAPRNKLLEAIDGEPMVRRVAGTALASGARPVVAVTGFDAAAVTQALCGLAVTIVHNPAYAEGLSTSLRAGLGALPADCAGAFVCLADMPAIESSDLKILLAAFAARGGTGVCVPVRHGRQGNPVLWGAAFFPEMMAIQGDIGAKQLLARHEESVTKVEMASDAIFADIDAPADLARVKMKLRNP